MRILLATKAGLFDGDGRRYELPNSHCLCLSGTHVWCGTAQGVWKIDHTPQPDGLEGLSITALSAGSDGTLWAGTDPSGVYRRTHSWEACGSFENLPSRGEWSFPPRPDTHHVRWIGVEPDDPSRLYVAIEAGALLRSFDRGKTWHDRVKGGPLDTHQLLTLGGGRRVSAAGDGYFESHDGGESWSSPQDGLSQRYLWSAATFGQRIVVSTAPTPVLAHTRFHTGLAYRDGQRWRAATGVPSESSVSILRGSYCANSTGLYTTHDGQEWHRVQSSDAWQGHYVQDFVLWPD